MVVQTKPGKNRRKILLVGWDAADWKVINPLMDAGKMPFLQSLVNRGVMGNLATQHPVLSPMLWTSIATGKRPYKHGVLGFVEPLPDQSAIRPVSSLSRQTKAIWNIFNQQGLRSNVIGWWPSHPAEPINGIMVSNHYQAATGPIDQPWPMPKGTVHPRQLEQQFAGIRFHPNEVVADQLLQFVPRAAEVDQESDTRIAAIIKVLAESTSVHMAASYAMQESDWDLTAVYYDAIDHFGHGFMKYHPPQREHIPREDYELYQGVMETAYRYQDMMLGGLLRLTGEDTTVIIVSDHGFHTDHNRPVSIPHQPAGPAIEHRDYGIVVMAGPDIRQDDIIHGASQLDITPTILALMGLPIGEDMDGKPLVQAFRSWPEIEYIPSWDGIEGNSGMHKEAHQTDPLAAREAIRQLIALGYIDDTGSEEESAVSNTADELQFNLALSFMDGNLHADAEPVLAGLYNRRPDEHRFGIQLALCYRALDRIEQLDALIGLLHERRLAEAGKAVEVLREFHARHHKPENATSDQHRQWYENLDKENRKHWKRLQLKATVPVFDTEYLRGYVAAARGDHGTALKHLQIAEQAQPSRPGLHIQIGDVYTGLRQWQKAGQAFHKALAIEPENAYAELGLARVYHCQRQPRPAIRHAIQAISLVYEFPMAHFVLGRSLAQLRKYDEAERALQIALRQNPCFREVHLRLALLYERQLNNPERAMQHRKLAKELAARPRQVCRESAADRTAPIDTPYSLHLGSMGHNADHKDRVITVVTGLPRSGTSMMMQMLSAGGMEVLADGARSADADNPRGYFELQEATRLHRQSDWIGNAMGKAVKIVAQLLRHLPGDFSYKVIFMQRDINEVLQSQKVMLDRHHKDGAAITGQQLRKAFEKQLQEIHYWLEQQKNIDTLFVNYDKVLEDPGKTAEVISGFLDRRLSVSRMGCIVDPTLHRQKKPHRR